MTPLIFALNDDGNLLIIDGHERLYTLLLFLKFDLVLIDLTILKELNGLSYTELPLGMQKKICNTSNP